MTNNRIRSITILGFRSDRLCRLCAGVLAIGVVVAGTGLARGQEALSRPPYPPSQTITSIQWAPLASVVRRAKGGDNWPVTWAADGTLVSAYGDGWGFKPKVSQKLSLGLVRVSGGPADFRGTNLRSDSIEQTGQGRHGMKAWGMLSVDGVLYMWMGHADNNGGQSRLAWSRDNGRNWDQAEWRFPEFGLIGFVNFGQDYQGARDDFVYCYSHDGPRADKPADRFVMMRVPREKIAVRAAYEFYAGVRPDGRPRWSQDVEDREAVFKHDDACLRSGMTYNAGIKRYLWWQAIPQPPGHVDRGDTRFEGGFGVYEAREPWGPWSTAYFTTAWDTGPGEHGDFPSKWMNADGTGIHLVFSGDDSFSVRGAKIEVVQD